MIIPFPVPIFIRNLFGNKQEDRNKEIEGHIQMVNLTANLRDKLDEENKRLYNQLTAEQKEYIDNKKPPMNFPDYLSYADWKNVELKSLIKEKKEN